MHWAGTRGTGSIMVTNSKKVSGRWRHLVTAVVLLSLGGGGSAVFAEPVARQRAAAVAGDWWSLRCQNTLKGRQMSAEGPGGLKSLRSAPRSKTAFGVEQGQALFDEEGAVRAHQFDLPGGGAVVIAADDTSAPVFFYSLDSRFDPSVPPAAAIWQEYCRQTKETASGARSGGAHPFWRTIEQSSADNSDPVFGPAANPIPDIGSSAVSRGPLLRTRWHQDEPYNLFAPERIDCTYPGSYCRCPIGCVATAFAQILAFWQGPVYGTGVPAGGECYTWNNGDPDAARWPQLCFDRSWYDGEYLPVCDDADAPFYDWRNMSEATSTSDPPVMQNAVAKLSYHCAVSVTMSFCSGGAQLSGAMSDAVTPVHYFGCATGAYVISKSDFSDDHWFEEVKRQINLGWPLWYSIPSHSIVVDGYSEDLVGGVSERRLHVNMGWGGSSDGWYLVGSMPRTPGYEGAIVNLRPAGFGDGPRAREVDADGRSGEYATIQAAINASTDGDEIVLRPGVYTGWGNRDLDFWGKAITVRSVNPDDPTVVAATVIDCEGTHARPRRGFLFRDGETGNSIVAGLTITGGYAPTQLVGDQVISVGGAILCQGASPTIRQCVIKTNSAGVAGGAVFCSGGGGPTIERCVIAGNAAGSGGGVAAWLDNGPVLESCLLTGNTGTEGVALHFWEAGQAKVINCTLSGNALTGSGGEVVACQGGDVSLVNSVLWNEAATANTEISVRGSQSPSRVSVAHSDVQGGQTGVVVEAGAVLDWTEGNIEADPAFVSVSGVDGDPSTWQDNDYHLSDGSPGVEAGDNLAIGNGGRNDLDGNPRLAGSNVDMGAYEFGSFMDCDANGIPDRDEEDRDQDRLIDSCDNCPDSPNPAQEDLDGDGAGDDCDPDLDGDGVSNENDNCPRTANADQQDGDGDGVGDLCDNCPFLTNPDQADADGDGTGDECEAARLYVDARAPAQGDGESWSTALASLEEALSAAAGSGGRTTEIWVAAGTYRPSREVVPSVDCSATFAIPPGVGVYGGFAGSETALEERRPLLHRTVLSGDRKGNDVPGAGPSDPSRRDNCYHVVTVSGGDATIVVDGFVITAGSGMTNGGGMVILGGSPTIADCRFIDNASPEGGGVYVTQAAPRIMNCVFLGNRAVNGGGVYTLHADPILSGCVFSGNTSSANAGGLFCGRGQVTLLNCTVIGNSTVMHGGGAYITSDATATVTNCVFWGNTWQAAPSIGRQIDGSTTVAISHCAIEDSQGLWEDGNNTWRNPMLVDPDGADDIWGTEDDDWHLSASSPCVDAGTLLVPDTAAAVDPDGESRVQNCRIDIGADESASYRDCNGNAIPDGCELLQGTESDCDANGVLDSCEVFSRARLLVTSNRGDKVLSFDGISGDYLGPFVDRRATDLRDPRAIVVDSRRNVYVAAAGSDSVIEYAGNSGLANRRFVSPDLRRPTALLLVEPTLLLVANGQDNSVVQFDLDTGQALGLLVQPGEGGLDGPSAMLRSFEGSLLVASRRTNQVLEYDWKTGAFVRVACEGAGLSAPSSLLLERGRNILVASHDTGEILRYAQDGTFLGWFVSSGSGGLTSPGSMVWGPGGNLLVCSLKNQSVLEFSGLDGSPVDHDPRRPGVQAAFVRGGYLGWPTGLAFVHANDCNGNGMPDRCDITMGVSADCNENDWPDECEGDADGDGIINPCDDDDDNDGIPDDGDGSGRIGDKPCDGSVLVKCDDNCPYDPNPDQVDSDGDGRGDACDVTLFVDSRATGANDGSNWANAFTDLQDALDTAAGSGGLVDEIWVAEGVYRPDRNSGDRPSTFMLVPAVWIYGGFAGNEVSVGERRPLQYPTVLTGDLLRNDNGRFDPGRAADNCYHVVTSPSSPPSVRPALLDGFVITGGWADGHQPNDRGGGLLIINSGPIVARCEFRMNYARKSGGAVFGGYYANPAVVNCRFLLNRSGEGGALCAIMESNAQITNCLFAGNSAKENGGAVHVQNSSPRIVNCTIAANWARRQGGGISVERGSPMIANSIVWGNSSATASGTNAQIFSRKGGEFVAHCCVQDEVSGDGQAFPGIENIDRDPLFVRPANDGGDGWGIGGNDDLGDMHLRGGSPCIDRGNTVMLGEDTADLNGNRVVNELVPVDLAGFERIVRAPDDEAPAALPGTSLDVGAFEKHPDCNENGIPDMCDANCGMPNGPCDVVGCGSSADCNGDKIPDECQADDDGDGQADVCERLYGDFDLDGDVDQSDFGLLQRCLSPVDSSYSDPACSGRDLNRDGKVNRYDVETFKRCLGGPDCPADPNCAK